MSPFRARKRAPSEASQPVEPGESGRSVESVDASQPVEPGESGQLVTPLAAVRSGEETPVVPTTRSVERTGSHHESAPALPATLAVRFQVSRSRKGDARPHIDTFEFNVEPGATVLDALLTIRRRHDPSLVVRHSCMHASCGACGVRVNAREVLACDSKLADLPTEQPILVEPLANQRVVADLATDMVDFHARFQAAAMPLVRASEAWPGAVPPDGIKAFNRFEDCIECGLCLSTCPIARMDRAYIGPAALAAAGRVVEEPRGRDLGPVLALAAEPDSVWRCRDAMECTAVCPAAVDPAWALLTLRRHVAWLGLRRFIRRGT